MRIGMMMLVSAMLAGCAFGERPSPSPLPFVAPERFDLRSPVLPSLDDVREAAAEDRDRVDQGRARLLRVIGLSYGAQSGLAATTATLRAALLEQAALLDRTFDFNRVVVRPEQAAMTGGVVVPPVVVVAEAPIEVQESGVVLRAAERRYEMVQSAQFAVSAPDWRAYLLREYDPPPRPPDDVLPKTDAERRIWRQAVDEGWEAGAQQARRILADDLARLERDYVGMIRYRRLVLEGKIADFRMTFGARPLALDSDEAALRVRDVVGRIVEQARWRTDRAAERAWERVGGVP